MKPGPWVQSMSWGALEAIGEEALESGCGKQGLGDTFEFTAMEKNSRAEQRCDLTQLGLSNHMALPALHICYRTNSDTRAKVLCR